MRLYGDISSLPDNLISKIEPEPNTGCWLWSGAISNGYGSICVKINGRGRTRKAHRVIFELLDRPIPKGLDIDHLCRVRSCVCPSHLEPVTRSENLRRANAFYLTGKCFRGHSMDPDNTYTYTGKSGNPIRQCLACNRLRSRLRRARKPEEVRAAANRRYRNRMDRQHAII